MKKAFLLLYLGSCLTGYAQIKYIGPSGPAGAPAAVVVDEVPLAHTAQLLPLDKSGTLAGKESPARQLEQVMKNIAASLREVNAGMDDIVKLNICLNNPGILREVQAALGKAFRGGKVPAISYVTGNLPVPGALLGIDAVAVAAKHRDKKTGYYNTADTYNPAAGADVAVLPPGGVVYVSGQADKGALAEATAGTLKQLDATLNHLGLKKEDVVQIRAFVNPMSDVQIADQAFKTFFGEATVPPVVYVEWVSKDPVVEIELIAASPAGGQAQLDFITPPGMTPSPVYSKVVRLNHGKKVYCSSLYGKTAGGAAAEVNDLFSNLKKVLQAAGSDFRHLVKAVYYVSDNNASAQLNELRKIYYDPARPPAASKAAVQQLGLPGHGITIDMIGVVK